MNRLYTIAIREITLGLILPLITLMLLSCAKQGDGNREPIPGGTIEFSMVDQNATQSTKTLLNNLGTTRNTGVILGQQQAYIEGHGQSVREYSTQCDISEVSGKYPLLTGEDFIVLTNDENDFDGNWYDKQSEEIHNYIVECYKQGIFTTLSWHFREPYKGEEFYTKDMQEFEKNNAFRSILEGGENHDYYKAKLDLIADFLKSLKDSSGELIPVIFRPFHEMEGGWFWWGSDSGTEQEYNELWRFTVEYLRDKKGVNNFIYAFSPSYGTVADSYELRNPGVDYFDIAGVDIYINDREGQVEKMVRAMEVIVEYAQEHDKVPALTEFGYRNGINNSSDSLWFTESFLRPVLASPSAHKIAYALTWTNTKSGVWVPLKGDLTYDNFVEFYDHPYTIFLNQWTK